MFIQPIVPIENLSFDQDVNTSKSASAAQVPFASMLQEAVDNLKEVQAAADQDAYNLAMGNMDDLSGMMINSAKQATAIEFTTQLSTRIVNAYKEIMQIQV